MAAAAVAAGTVTVSVSITGEFRGSIAGTKPEDDKDTIPAKSACTRFTKPSFPVRGRPLAYNVSFGNPDLVKFRKGIFFAFYYDPKQVGRPQKLYNAKPGGASLLAVAKPYKGFGLAGEGWAASAELIGRAAQHARRIETVPVVERHNLRQRRSRIRPWATARQMWRAAGRIRIAPVRAPEGAAS